MAVPQFLYLLISSVCLYPVTCTSKSKLWGLAAFSHSGLGAHILEIFYQTQTADTTIVVLSFFCNLVKKKNCFLYLFASWEIFHECLSSVDVFQNQLF